MDSEQLVSDIRAAAQATDPVQSVKAYLSDLVKDPENFNGLEMDPDAEEAHYFEDETLSIWNCRFLPGKVVPPHEHLMTVHIASYGGKEKNYLFQHDGKALKQTGTEFVPKGSVLTLEKDTIHAVTADGSTESLAIHVYFGPLTKVNRNLFDWETGDRLPFTDGDYERLARSVSETTFQS